MADTEKKVVLTVGTGNSQQTVKGLKDEIKQLRDTLLNLEKGSDKYNEAVSKLQDDQRRLNAVMALTKKEATALDGSYDALVHKMSQLKKEWRATADEAERADLGGQIDEINTKLKEMDASTGNFQRNVGNYVSHWEGMPDAVDGVAKSVSKVNDEMVAASAAPKDFGAAMREMNESIEPTKQKFEAVGNIASGLASGFAAVQGAMGLLGIESENWQKTMIKVQSAMALAQGISGLKGLVEGLGKAKVAFAGLGDKIKAVSKTMGATGWIAVIMAVVSAITILVSWLNTAKDESEEMVEQLEKQEEMFSQIGSEIGNTVGQFKLLQAGYKNLKNEADKKRWIDENASAFSALGLAINDVNSANKTFLNDAPKIIEALTLQAEAAALSSIYQKAYGEAAAKESSIKARMELYKTGYKPTEEEITAAGLKKGTDDFDYKIESYSEDANLLQKAIYLVEPSNQPAVVNSYDKVYQDYVGFRGVAKLKTQAKKELEGAYDEANAILENFKKKQKEAFEAYSSAGLGGGTQKTPDQIRDELVAANWDFINSVTEEQIAALDDIEIEDIEIDTSNKDGQAEDMANWRISLAEREANREIEAINNVAKAKDIEAKTEEERLKIEEERAAQEYAIIEELENKKLAILKEAKKKAEENGDITGAWELAQQIADQEVAIEKAKYDEFKRLRDNDRADREKDKAERIQMVKSIADTTVAGLSATKEILDKVAESYEIDGEISEEEAKKLKAIKYSTTVIDMMQGIVSALASAAGGGPAGWIAGGIQAASIATVGAMSLKEISKQDFKTTNNTPTVLSSAYQSDLPFNYTRQVTGAQEYESLNKDTKVYVLESDISNAMNKVKVRENESSF